MEGVPKMAIVAAMIMNLLKALRSTWSWITMEKDNSLYQFKQYLLHRRKK